MIYELMAEFGQPKSVILKEIYIREVPLILHRLQMLDRNKMLEKLNDNMTNLRIAVATAGMGASPEEIQKLFDQFKNTFTKLVPEKPSELQGENDSGESESEDPYEKLQRLQGIIAQTRQKRR